jgi:peroxidase
MPTGGAEVTMSLPEFRSADGSGNNLINPALNASAGASFVRFTPAEFSDGVSTPRDGVNARELSNIVVGQNGTPDPHIEDPTGSGFMYAWGQFIDHDLDLQKNSTTHFDIPVPNGDPALPAGSLIPVVRAAVEPGTGAGTHEPGAAINQITGFIDGSQVYGSSKAVADSLRLPDGHMKVTHENGQDFLPIVNGQFVAGDVRASENSALTSIQNLFLREHNHQVDALHKAHPSLTGDQLYQEARAIVGAEIENVTYNEFLPQLLGKNAVDKYHGFDAAVDPRISQEFAGAAFRLHSLVSDDITHEANDGSIKETHALKDDFGRPPQSFIDTGGPDGILKNLASEHAQLMDNRIVDDLRNFLGDPVGGAQDLAAVNIQRGRDMGLGHLNETRDALGLKPYTSFDQITSDKVTAKLLSDAYHGDLNSVDLWLGGSSEDHAKGAMVGSTFQAIIAQQFENVRDGDRFFFESGTQFSKHEINAIKHTTLGDIIERNTTADVQKNVFKASEDSDASHGPKADHGADHGPKADHGDHGVGHGAEQASLASVAPAAAEPVTAPPAADPVPLPSPPSPMAEAAPAAPQAPHQATQADFLAMVEAIKAAPPPASPEPVAPEHAASEPTASDHAAPDHTPPESAGPPPVTGTTPMVSVDPVSDQFVFHLDTPSTTSTTPAPTALELMPEIHHNAAQAHPEAPITHVQDIAPVPADPSLHPSLHASAQTHHDLFG